MRNSTTIHQRWFYSWYQRSCPNHDIQLVFIDETLLPINNLIINTFSGLCIKFCSGAAWNVLALQNAVSHSTPDTFFVGRSSHHLKASYSSRWNQYYIASSGRIYKVEIIDLCSNGTFHLDICPEWKQKFYTKSFMWIFVKLFSTYGLSVTHSCAVLVFI